MKFGLTDKELLLLKKTFEKFSEIENVFIYGSRAKNAHKRTSDIDLAISLKKDSTLNLALLKSELEELPIIYRIELINEAEIPEGNFKEEYLKTRRKLFR